VKIVAFDTETKGFDWFDPNQRAFLASWADEDGEYVANLAEPSQVGRFIEALQSADVVLAHNQSFDVHQTRETLGFDMMKELNCEFHDTDILARCAVPKGAGGTDSYKLKNLAALYLNADAKKPEEHISELGKSMGLKKDDEAAYYDIWRAYPEAMEYYAKMDARYTYDLYPILKDRLNEKTEKAYALEKKVVPVVLEAERVGVRLDPQAVRRLHKQYKTVEREEWEYLSNELGEAALGGKGSEDALIEALLKIGVPLTERTQSGDKLATNKFALQKFEDDFPQLQSLSRYRQADKFLSTYIGPMEGREVVHPSFLTIGAWTSRMSCMRPNMQNIPKRAGKEVRSMFVPREGHSFIVCDYDSIEVRLLAYYLNSPDFIDLIESGHDPHAWMAAQIHGGEIAEYEKGTDGQPLRDVAKNTLFAIIYGAGGPRVTDMNKLDPGPYDADGKPQYHEAKRLIRQIKTSVPRYYNLNERVRNKVKLDGFVSTLYGHRQPVNKDKAYVGLNALIQGTASGVMKSGLIEAAERLKALEGYPLLVVHDEGLFEVPNGAVKEAQPIIEQAFKEAGNEHSLKPTLQVTSKIVTTNYADA
jgi:DNA polymerase-1